MNKTLARLLDLASPEDGIAGIGAAAALRAMAPYWTSHFAEGHNEEILERDIDALIEALQALRAEVAK